MYKLSSWKLIIYLLIISLPGLILYVYTGYIFFAVLVVIITLVIFSSLLAIYSINIKSNQLKMFLGENGYDFDCKLVESVKNEYVFFKNKQHLVNTKITDAGIFFYRPSDIKKIIPWMNIQRIKIVKYGVKNNKVMAIVFIAGDKSTGEIGINFINPDDIKKIPDNVGISS